jgi:uncharacterized protein
MDAVALLRKYFSGSEEAFTIVFEHSRLVADKALAIGKALDNSAIDLHFVEEAALLHDIGVSRIHAPRIACHGAAPYICHGILGRELLELEELPRHALVCERHIGVGLGLKDIVQQQLPLPKRDMLPVTVEEKIICFADLFYSKKPGRLHTEKSVEEIRIGLQRHGSQKVAIFDSWLRDFLLE